LKEVFKQIESLSHSLKSVEKSIAFCSEQIDDFGTRLDSAINKISEIENKMLVYELLCNKHENKLNILKTINNTEELTLANKIEITGIPKMPNENTTEIYLLKYYTD